MRVVLNGKEVKCHSFCELKPGDVFAYLNAQGVFIKTNQNTCFNVCSGAMENYNNLPIIPYPDAFLSLDKVCKHKDRCEVEEDSE